MAVTTLICGRYRSQSDTPGGSVTPNGHASVDTEIHAGDPAGLVAREERGSVGNIPPVAFRIDQGDPLAVLADLLQTATCLTGKLTQSDRRPEASRDDGVDFEFLEIPSARPSPSSVLRPHLSK